MARLTPQKMTKVYGRPTTIKPVAVQQRLPWLPRRRDGKVQVVLAHPLIADAFVAACRAASERSDWTPLRIDSYYPRPIRGFNKPAGWKLGDNGTSSHSWATAFDFFATHADVPPPGGVWTPHNGMDRKFAEAFEERGFTWGGRWKRKDTPHLEYRQAPTAHRVTPQQFADYLSGMIKQGDTGPDVLDIQFALRIIGHPVQPTGIFDPATTGAVIAAQAAAGVAADGIVGPQTEQALWQLMWAKNPTVDAMIDAAYTDILGRLPDNPGRVHWTRQFTEGKLPQDVWRFIWNHEEAVRRRSTPAAPAELPPAPPAPPAPAPPVPPIDVPVPKPPAKYELASIADRIKTISETL